LPKIGNNNTLRLRKKEKGIGGETEKLKPLLAFG